MQGLAGPAAVVRQVKQARRAVTARGESPNSWIVALDIGYPTILS
jgi:hypothetical protein